MKPLDHISTYLQLIKCHIYYVTDKGLRLEEGLPWSKVRKDLSGITLGEVTITAMDHSCYK